MYLAPLTAAVLVLTSAGEAATQKLAEGQETRVCGVVKTQHLSPPACDAVLRVSSAGEELDVFVPASLRQALSMPDRMRGAEACFTGKVALASGSVSLRMGPGAAFELINAAPPSVFGAGAALPCAGNVTVPRVVRERKPSYTNAAMRERVQGTVEMEVVVGTDGAVREVEVIRSLHPELDQSAIEAVKEWQFAPGTVNGQAVAVLVNIEMTFTLRSGR
jgi:TonB family protein